MGMYNVAAYVLSGFMVGAPMADKPKDYNNSPRMIQLQEKARNLTRDFQQWRRETQMRNDLSSPEIDPNMPDFDPTDTSCDPSCLELIVDSEGHLISSTSTPYLTSTTATTLSTYSIVTSTAPVVYTTSTMMEDLFNAENNPKNVDPKLLPKEE